MFGKKNKLMTSIHSLISSGTSLEGKVEFSGGLRVDGLIKGQVTSSPNGPGMLVISEHARVEGSIDVSHLIVNGTVVGPIRAHEFLELQEQACIFGDVEYKNLEMHCGAVVDGCMVHAESKGASGTAGHQTQTEAVLLETGTQKTQNDH